MSNDSYTIRELKKMASDAKVKYYGNMRKDELMDTLGLGKEAIPLIWYVVFVVFYLGFSAVAIFISFALLPGLIVYESILLWLLVFDKNHRSQWSIRWQNPVFENAFSVPFGFPTYQCSKSLSTCLINHFPKRYLD